MKEVAKSFEGEMSDRILSLRGQRVMLDRDLAVIYGTTTKRLNEQVKRNKARFPEDFMFELTKEEAQEVVANCDHPRLSGRNGVISRA